MRRSLTAIALTFACAITARAQPLRGTVRDSVTRMPLGGVVVTVMDANGRTLTRAVTNQLGAYVVPDAQGARTVGALRIGFRPRTVPIAGVDTLDMMMTPIPPLLEQVTVRAASNCPARSDRLRALSLLQQARAGLLATVTARQTNRATLIRLGFKREWDADTKHIVDQQVALDSSGGNSDAFRAIRSGAEFVATGFVERAAPNGPPLYYGPDAETLLDDDFAVGYCFQIAKPDRIRPREIGLAFKASTRKRGRVDIAGTLWVDTVSKALRDIQFEYVGDERPADSPRTGGHIEFRTMGNGVVIVDRWMVRLSTARVEEESSGRRTLVYAASDKGGEVATASWDDGYTWHAPLGALRAVAIGYPDVATRGFVIRLKDTDYLGSPDANGILELPYLLPGAYVATVVDSVSALFGVTMPTSLSFDAARDSITERRFSLPRHEDYILNSCLTGSRDNSEPGPLPIQVLDVRGKPTPGAIVDISYKDRKVNGAVTERLIVDETGAAHSCLRYRRDDAVDVRVTYADAPVFTGRYRAGSTMISIRLHDAKR